jgi:NurA-like 5'-3' nuclease
MRDVVFSKLDDYVKNLNDMALTKEWKSYKEIPAERIYSMDAVRTDTIKHGSKVLCDADTMI